MRAVLAEIDTAEIELVYYGTGSSRPPTPIADVDSASVEAAFSWVLPAVDVVAAVLPAMRARGRGGRLFAGGTSSVRPMPALGQLALASAALRNYAITLHAALTGEGLYAGTLTIGGVVERGDIHARRSVISVPVAVPAPECSERPGWWVRADSSAPCSRRSAGPL
ncbi:hypothetical protein [Nocardia sp. NBC_01329]|uniref:hypothetical protein n=1 Tax=Nocardia sp. NBC_01329 TaxID=2903594 RepID=UPI002E145D4A|nr:hypothetical protein OG405_12025 [Nocardia sp. NBC_01329]